MAIETIVGLIGSLRGIISPSSAAHRGWLAPWARKLPDDRKDLWVVSILLNLYSIAGAADAQAEGQHCTGRFWRVLSFMLARFDVNL